MGLVDGAPGCKGVAIGNRVGNHGVEDVDSVTGLKLGSQFSEQHSRVSAVVVSANDRSDRCELDARLVTAVLQAMKDLQRAAAKLTYGRCVRGKWRQQSVSGERRGGLQWPNGPLCVDKHKVVGVVHKAIAQRPGQTQP